MDTFTDVQLAYLGSQRLGRLATLDPRGTPQNSPVGFRITEAGVVVIGGFALGASRKFRNAARHDRVSFVVDDLASEDPWVVRGVEVRGRAEALVDVEPDQPWMSREQLHVHPERIVAWGLDDPTTGSR